MVSQLSLFIIAFLPVLCHISIFTQVLLRENTVVFLQHNLALPDIKPSKQTNKNWKKKLWLCFIPCFGGILLQGIF